LYKSHAKIPDTQSQAGTGTTKKRRNVSRGNAAAKNEIAPYVAPEAPCAAYFGFWRFTKWLKRSETVDEVIPWESERDQNVSGAPFSLSRCGRWHADGPSGGSRLTAKKYRARKPELPRIEMTAGAMKLEKKR
jgi:hypothetical protein